MSWAKILMAFGSRHKVSGTRVDIERSDEKAFFAFTIYYSPLAAALTPDT
jgi:hypothetical protein